MQDNVSKIKDRLDIADVVSSYIKLQKAGVNFKACCPFHNEKTPSFYVTPERQIWHCFGCQKGGDMFSFVQEIENVDFGQALKILADKAGVKLDSFESSNKEDAANRLFDICELATKFFEVQLEKSTSGKRALDYLHQRGLNDETIKEFRLGFAPNDWKSLSQFLKDKGYTENEIIGSGLSLGSQRGLGIYDRFRSRIVFPIADTSGRVVGFTGRIFESDSKDEAKYINTPQTRIYDKGRILYGLNRAKADIKRLGRCVLVEGNMDAIMSFQGGVKNVVATSGTALTENHLKMLARFTKNLDFCFDTDQAGAMATRRGIGLALAQEFVVNVVSINDPECKDPADYVRKYNTGWNDLVSNSKPVLEFYFEQARKSFDPRSAESKTIFLNQVAPFIKRLKSSIERSHWLSQLAFLFQVSDKDIANDLNRIKDDLGGYQSVELKNIIENKSAVQNVSTDILNEAILSLVLKDPLLFRSVIKEEDYSSLDNEAAEILKAVVEYKDSGFSLDTFLNSFNDNVKTRIESFRIIGQDIWAEFSNQDLIQEFNFLINKAKIRKLRTKLSNLVYEIGQAERDRDVGRYQELGNQFSEITKQLSKIEKI